MPHLNEILSTTRAGLDRVIARLPQLERDAERQPVAPDFRAALRGSRVALIAEVKRRSPSIGAINEGLDPVALATAYAMGGAGAISVLTDAPFFGGALADLVAVAQAVAIPVIRKDFILHRAQLVEARAAGAAAALLIVRALTQPELVALLEDARRLRLATLVETHTREEITRAADAGAEIIGINARDLDTFQIDTSAAWRMLAQVPPHCVAVAESGMATADDVEAAALAGADAVLVGSALARSADPEAAARALSGAVRRDR